MGADKEKEITAAIKLLTRSGYKKPVKLKNRDRSLYLEITYLIGLESVFVKKDKKFSPRKVQMRVAKSDDLDAILDKHFTGKPFSKNTLKLIVPQKDIARSSEGGMENTSYKMISTKKELFLFNPNLCFHRAGKIKEDYQREQIMI